MTEELLSPERPATLLAELQRLVAERAAGEAEIPHRFAAASEALKMQYAAAVADVDRQYQEEKSATEQEYASVRRAIEAQYEGDSAAAQKEYRQVCAEIVARFETAEKTQNEQLREAQWEATTIFEATENGCTREAQAIEERLAEGWREIDALHESAVRLLKQRSHWQDFPPPTPGSAAPHDRLAQRFAELTAEIRNHWYALQSQSLPRMVVSSRVLAALVSVAGVVVPLVGVLAGVSSWPWLPAGAALGVGACLSSVWLARAAAQQSVDGYLTLRQAWADAGQIRQQLVQVVTEQSRQQRAQFYDQLNAELRKADSKSAGTLTELSRKMQHDLEHANTKYPALLAQIVARHERQLQQSDAKYLGRLEALRRQHGEQTERLTGEHARQVAAAEAEYRRDSETLSQRWHDGMRQVSESLAGIGAVCDRLFPDFGAMAADGWTLPQVVPAAVRIGRYDFDLARLENGVPADPRLKLPTTQFVIPAFSPFPLRSALLLESDDDGAATLELIQTAMLRMLTALPPGKVRMTIIDPLGLGEQFAAFMHLADFDEKLVTNRIWTESQHIEQRLTDLTEYMENAIQLFLRNEFQTIQEYNQSAGEMAEPYRLLVVANYPANFTEAATRRLTSIITSGARCGVFTVLSYQAKQRLPREFRPKELQPHALLLSAAHGEFRWTQTDVGPLALVRDALPAAQTFTDLVRHAGRAAQAAARVEVPFAAVVPGDLWHGDAAAEIDVPLGRAGARKLQHLHLGKGTAQHVLISGKTGSGKSTLLHVLVTSLALRYSPDEVELYLVDFKKGVEFKAYASLGLPHARVIAIESEREFGLSVLQRLDAELKRRGDLFRNQGVQDLKGFRAAQPQTRLPRALLIVDEFQELFVEDDRIAQEAALLLDRLVRQGRAFGLHVLLGSQTLAGAYSLPRSTLGQMAVRIALQCSESDAHLILSEDNTAARLLSRPGEAIYNDANGLFEGNHPFQVVWLSDSERDQQVRRVGEHAAARGVGSSAIVFEGNAAAEIGLNPALADLLAAPAWPEPTPAPKAWLGAPVAIKEPTAVELLRQSGSNLLVLGHHEELSLGMLSAAVLGLAAQTAPASKTRFVILNGAPADSAWADFWPKLRDALPHDVVVAGVREAAGLVAELAAETARRTASGDDGAPLWCLVVYNLGRFRELRKSDDDFGYSRIDENAPPNPGRQFADILREGPALGIHTLTWCDTYHTVQRFFDRRALGEFELRAVMHMNAADSSSLIESPAASQLGIHRALLYHAAEAWQEKFSPYGPPSQQWLDGLKQRLAAR